MESVGVRTSFDVEMTPPEERARRRVAAESLAEKEVIVLRLTSKCPTARVDFRNIPFGLSAVRQVLVQNPGKKPLKVSLESLPSPDSGFEVEFVDMTLPGRYEARLRIGWAPSKEGVLAEKIHVKFGRHSATLRLVASCINAQNKFRFDRSPVRSVNLVYLGLGWGPPTDVKTPVPEVDSAKVAANPVVRQVPPWQPRITPMPLQVDIEMDNLPSDQDVAMSPTALELSPLPLDNWEESADVEEVAESDLPQVDSREEEGSFSPGGGREVAASVIQRGARRFLAQQKAKGEQEKKLAAAIKIQRVYRSYLRCNKAEAAAVIIQRGTRRFLRLRKTRRDEKQLAAATKIQKAYRSYSNRKTNRRQTAAAVIIQRRARRFLSQKKVKRHQEKQLAAVIKIQNVYRSYSNRKTNRRQTAAAVIIQRGARQFLSQKKAKRDYEKQLAAAIKIQQTFRSYSNLKTKRRQTAAAVIIQRRARRFLSQKKAKSDHEKQLAAAIKIQHAFRSYSNRKMKRREAAASIIQRKTRRFLISQKARRGRERRELVAAVRIQRAFRSYQNAKLELARMKARDEERLERRTEVALNFLYHGRDLGRIICELKTLELATRSSASCCGQLIVEGDRCLLRLIDLVENCNRSVPHMEIIVTAFDIVINLNRHEPALDVILGQRLRVTSIAAHMMSIYKEKSLPIFKKGCTILRTLAEADSSAKESLIKNVGKTLLGTYDFFLKRRQNHPNQSKTAASKTLTKQTSLSTVATKTLTKQMSLSTAATKTLQRQMSLSTSSLKVTEKRASNAYDPFGDILSLVKQLGLVSQ